MIVMIMMTDDHPVTSGTCDPNTDLLAVGLFVRHPAKPSCFGYYLFFGPKQRVQRRDPAKRFMHPAV